MTFTQAELYRLMDFLYIQVFKENPKPRTIKETKQKLLGVINDIKAKSMTELKTTLGY